MELLNANKRGGREKNREKTFSWLATGNQGTNIILNEEKNSYLRKEDKC